MDSNAYAQTFREGVPEGSQISQARAQVVPGRTWVRLGDAAGTEIYLDADQAARFLVRTVVTPEPVCGDGDGTDD